MPVFRFLTFIASPDIQDSINEWLKIINWLSDHPGVLAFYFVFLICLFAGAVGFAYFAITIWIENTSGGLEKKKKITSFLLTFKTENHVPLSLAAAIGIPVLFLLPVHALNYLVDTNETSVSESVESEKDENEKNAAPANAKPALNPKFTERSIIQAFALQEFLMLFICVVLFAFASARGFGFKEFGLEMPPRLSQALGWGIGSYWCCILTINFIGLFYIVFLYLVTGGLDFPPNPIETIAREGKGDILPVALFLVAVAGAPLFEEFIFRGAIYPGLKSRLSRPAAAVISALLFALVHPYTHWAHIFLLGLLFVYLYERTGSLWPSIALHATNNAMAMVNLFILLPHT